MTSVTPGEGMGKKGFFVMSSSQINVTALSANESEVRVIECQYCDGGHIYHGEYDQWRERCRVCDGRGFEEIEVESITLEDLDTDE